jgi:hypothetical protein
MIDFNAHYAVAGWPGVAFYLMGWLEYPGPDTEWDGIMLVDRTQVRAVMVGDDREHVIDVDDLTEIADEDYCGGCGQIGCGHG